MLHIYWPIIHCVCSHECNFFPVCFFMSALLIFPVRFVSFCASWKIDTEWSFNKNSVLGAKVELIFGLRARSVEMISCQFSAGAFGGCGGSLKATSWNCAFISISSVGPEWMTPLADKSVMAFPSMTHPRHCLFLSFQSWCAGSLPSGRYHIMSRTPLLRSISPRKWRRLHSTACVLRNWINWAVKNKQLDQKPGSISSVYF